MKSPSAKSMVGGVLLVVAAVVPALLTALPGRIELRRAREDALLTPGPDAGDVFSAEEARRRLEEDVVPFAQEAASYVALGAPTSDAAGDRVLHLVETAKATGAIFVSSTPVEKSERSERGYLFHTVALKAEGSFAAVHAYLSSLERGARLIVVTAATLRRDEPSGRPGVLLDARLTFVERTEAPDPEAVFHTSAESRRSGR